MKTFKIKNYKCFVKDGDFQGFDVLKPINVIIGKNNSGKSKILEALEQFIVKNTHFESKCNVEFDLQISKDVKKEEFSRIFSHNNSGCPLGVNFRNSRTNHWDLAGQ